jgi:hypothetical protein
VLLEGLGKLKNPMTSLGTEPATFGLVVYYLNQLHYSAPHSDISSYTIQHRILGRHMNDELDRIWKEAVVLN